MLRATFFSKLLASKFKFVIINSEPSSTVISETSFVLKQFITEIKLCGNNKIVHVNYVATKINSVDED